MINEKFPYQDQYVFYLKTVKQYKTKTLRDSEIAISSFWSYYITNSSTTEIKEVTEADVRSFLSFAEKHSNYKKTTINKYLVHLKSYFAWLDDHNLIKKLPTLFINGRPIPRQNTFVINWMRKLPDLINNEQLSDTTKKVLIAISLGYLPNELIDLKCSDIYSRLNAKTKNDDSIKNFLKTKMDSNDYLFQSTKRGHEGEKLKTNAVLWKKLREDNEKLSFDDSLLSLRQSYVYSIVKKRNLSDDEMLRILKCNLKTLTYYKQNALLFKFIDY